MKSCDHELSCIQCWWLETQWKPHGVALDENDKNDTKKKKEKEKWVIKTKIVLKWWQ